MISYGKETQVKLELRRVNRVKLPKQSLKLLSENVCVCDRQRERESENYKNYVCLHGFPREEAALQLGRP